MEQRFFLGEIFKMLSKRKSQIIIFSFFGLMIAGLVYILFCDTIVSINIENCS